MRSLLDKIKTKQKTHYGVIDFVTKKQVIFYDFTHDSTPALRLLVLSWRTDTEEQPDRFSVYCMLNYPDFRLPPPLIVPVSLIVEKGAPKPTRLSSTVKKV